MKKKISYIFVLFLTVFIILPQLGKAAVKGQSSLSIKPPVAMLTIISPRGGEQWEVGKDYAISWNYAGYTSTDIKKIKIWTEKVAGSRTLKFVLDKNIAELSENDIKDGEPSGTFFWTASTTDPSPVKVKQMYVEALLKNGNKYKSSKNFYIVKPEDIPVGSVTVTHPNGGERFFLGKNINITWQTDKELTDDNFFRIYLIKKSTGERIVTISNNVARWTRNFYWNYSLSSVNSKVVPGNDYAIKIELCDKASCSYRDESDTAFSLVNKVNYSLIVTSPEQPGLQLETGQTFDIKWDYLGDLTSSNVEEVRISLERQEGMGFVVDSNIAVIKKEDIPKGQNSGIYSWTVSSNGKKEMQDYYRVSVKVIADDKKEYSDRSDSSFQIGFKGQSDSIITVQNPNGGGKFEFGYNLNGWGTVKDWETNLKETDYFKAVLIKKSTGEEVLTLNTAPAMARGIDGVFRPAISFWWIIPKDKDLFGNYLIKPGNDYAIKLILCESKTVCNGAEDTSDRGFSISDGKNSLIVTSPEQPGLQLETGQTFDIKWDYLGDLTSSNVEEVRISLERQEGMGFVVDSNIAVIKKEDIPKGQNSGIYSWTVSSNGKKEMQDYYRVSVKVIADDKKEYSDRSDSSFQIGFKGQSDSIITVQNPNGGGRFVFGYNLNGWGAVKDWETNLKPTDYFRTILIKKSTGEELLTLNTLPAMVKQLDGVFRPAISFWWIIPKDGSVKPGNDYAIKLILCESITVCNGAEDTSDRGFSISKEADKPAGNKLSGKRNDRLSKDKKDIKDDSALKVLYPNGGETLNSEQKYKIEWSVKNIKKIKWFNIELLDTSSSTNKAIAIMYPSKRSYLWKVPKNFESGNYLLKVSACANSMNSKKICDTAASDTSDAWFRIVASLNKGAFFQFNYNSPETFVFKLTEPSKIRHARNILSGREKNAVHVRGLIDKTPVDYNSPWNYNLAPDSINFFENAGEVCDAGIGYVEKHLDEVGGSFLPGNLWCPWGSKLIKEIKK